MINLSEIVFVHAIKVSTFRSRKVYRLMAVINDVSVAKCQHRKTKDIPFTCDLKLIIFIPI